MSKKVNIAIDWSAAPASARIDVAHGSIASGRAARGDASFANQVFKGTPNQPARLELAIDANNAAVGPNPTAVTVWSAKNPFTFLVRDVGRENPIFIPDYNVAVLPANDSRTFEQVAREVRAKKRLTNLQRIEREPEETFEQAAAATRELISPIWMGVSRDVRIFEMALRSPMQITDTIQPRFHGNGYVGINMEPDYLPGKFGFVAGRGWGCTENTWRHLDERVLPIFRAGRTEEDVKYDMTAFVTLEKSPLKRENIRGTHFLVADGLSVCHAFTEEQEKAFKSLRDAELNVDEETVLCCRVVATNSADVPRYAWFKAVHPVHGMYGSPNEHTFDAATGFTNVKDSAQVMAVNRIDGGAMPQQEIAVLVPPGGTCTFDFFIPHRPISAERAAALAKRDVARLLDECRAFWRAKLDEAARIRIPETRFDEMVRAGLLQLDLITYGREPDGVLAVGDGIYGPVSAEVWKNINFFESLGLHDQARRGLQYFLEKQHDNGFMQNFVGYMLDTGCVLYALGEHYLYTRDDAWAKAVAAKVIKSCQFLIDWRARNKRDDLRGKGYGLMEGKVADPEDQERTFMLNAYAFAGFRGAAALLARVEPEWSRKTKDEAAELQADMRTAFEEALAVGPVIPLADGTWSPTAGAWVGTKGPVALMTDGKSWWSHGSMNIRDDVLGPLHLVARGAIDARDPLATTILNFSNELGFSRNVASSQPYYGQHPLVHLLRGEPKAFLKSWYNAVAALADRHTYSWWEHLWHMSPHKTAETAEFLMETRWMLWLEDGDNLHLLGCVPRAWLEPGKTIELSNVASYFGKLSLAVRSLSDAITADITCDSDRKPKRVTLRLPHSREQKATRVEGGIYDAERETITIDNFTGRATVRATFSR